MLGNALGAGEGTGRRLALTSSQTCEPFRYTVREKKESQETPEVLERVARDHDI